MTFLIGAAVVLAVVLAPQPQTDLAVYRLGGRAVWHGAVLYDVRSAGKGLPFTYPPIAAVLFGPIALPPLGVAEAVWSALTVWALVRVLHEVRAVVLAEPPGGHRAAGADRLAGAGRLVASRWSPPLLLAAALATEPVRSTLIFGQVNVLLMLAVWLDLNRRAGRRGPAGVLLGLAAAVKLTPLVFVPYLWLTGRRRTAIGAVATFLVAHAVAFGAAPGASRAYWGGVVADPGRIGSVGYAGNQSLSAALARVVGDTASSGRPYRAALVVIAAAGLLVAVRLHRRGAPTAGLLACAVTGLLVSPISWSHHWVWVVPALLWLAVDTAAPGWRTIAALAGYVLFVAAPFWWVAPHEQDGRAHHDLAQLVTDSYPLAGVAFLVALAWSYRRRRVGTTPTPTPTPTTTPTPTPTPGSLDAAPDRRAAAPVRF